MRTRLLLTFFFLPALLAQACSSDDGQAAPISSGEGGSGGSGQAGAAQAGAGGAKAGAGGSAAGQPGGGQAGAGASGAGAGGEGPAGAAGEGGAAGAGAAGAGAGGASGAGAGGAGGSGPPDCCTPGLCGAGKQCVEGGCFELKAGECFSQTDCGGKACLGVSICPCNAQCQAPTTPGKCDDGGGPGGAGGAGGAAPADWQKCGAPGDCVVQPNSCCGSCGAPTIKQVDAVNSGKTGEHQKAVCSDPNPVCPACPASPNPDLLATCALGPGVCTLVEVSKSLFAECSKDDDCELRAPQCCSCGPLTVDNLVAIGKLHQGDYMNELGCALVDCAPCADPPKPPAGVKAVCDTTTSYCRISQ